MWTTRSAAAGSVRAIRASRQLVREIEAELHRPDARPELGDLAIALEEDPDVDRILVDRPETAQMFDDERRRSHRPSRGVEPSSSSTVMPGTQTCAWLTEANSRSQCGHTQRVTSADCAVEPCGPRVRSWTGRVVVEFPLVATARARSSGLWRSLVAHLTGGQGVASSNPASPTKRSMPSDPGRTCINRHS